MGAPLMPDWVDLSQDHQARALVGYLARALRKPAQPSAFFCEACGEPIDERRRQILDGVTRCCDCQQREEQQRRHVR
ncbi:TraR/DksA C4-type zinc finger protein [Chimaeribacter californicus]|nr:TraR/DksA C4-type zinc finger protein [Chimaeribacter californicus]